MLWVVWLWRGVIVGCWVVCGVVLWFVSSGVFDFILFVRIGVVYVILGVWFF